MNPIGRRSCYGETLFSDYNRQHNLRIKVGRIFNTYGPNMRPNDERVVSNSIMQALQNKPITIYGEGRQTRSFCYVDDLIEAFVRFMATDDDIVGSLNLGNSGEFTIRELAEKMIELTDSKLEMIFESLPSDDSAQRKPDITQAENVLGWKLKIALEQGLKNTIPYFERFCT